MSGYLTKNYAESLAEFGLPYFLPKSKSWILKQTIPNSDYIDARGCYPLFTCVHPQKLVDDFAALNEEIVSLAFVTDPFSPYKLEDWQKIMPDVCFPYKTHFMVELQNGYEQALSRHHLRNVRKASQILNIKHTNSPDFLLNRWLQLYSNLIERHNIRGIARFSKDGFKKQLTTPGIRATWAEYEDIVIGIVLWYKMKNNVFYHLAAYDETGYRMKASYAIFNYALQIFREEGVEFVNLGAGAGLTNSGNDGLTRFKKGWANTTRPVYFCGRIFNTTLYNTLTRAGSQKASQSFFPAYRSQ